MHFRNDAFNISVDADADQDDIRLQEEVMLIFFSGFLLSLNSLLLNSSKTLIWVKM